MAEFVNIVSVVDGNTDENGFYHSIAHFARAGIQEYPVDELRRMGVDTSSFAPGQRVKVLRPESEVFDASSMASFENVPITDQHEGGAVSPDNARGVVLGSTKGPVVKDAQGRLAVPVVLYDAKLIHDVVTKRRRQLSAGYGASIKVESGVDPTHGVYDAIMKNFKGNHISVVDFGKAGPQYIMDARSTMTEKREYKGVSIEMNEQSAQVFDAIVSERDSITGELSELRKDLGGAKKEIETLTAKVDHAKETKVTDSDLDEMVAERTQFLDKVAAVAPNLSILFEGGEKKGKSKPADLLRQEAVASSCSLPLEGKSDEYITALFDAEVDRRGKEPKEKNTKEIMTPVTDSGKSVSQKARAEFIEKRSGR